MRYIAWPFSSARWSTILRRHCRACACAILLQDSNLLQRPTSYAFPVWEWRRLSTAPSSRPHLDRDGITHEQANKENNIVSRIGESEALDNTLTTISYKSPMPSTDLFKQRIPSKTSVKDDMITTITSSSTSISSPPVPTPISLFRRMLQDTSSTRKDNFRTSHPTSAFPTKRPSKNPSYSFWAAFEYIWTDATLRPHLTQSDFEHLLLLVLRTDHPDRSTTLRTLRNRIRESPIRRLPIHTLNRIAHGARRAYIHDRQEAVEYLIEIAKDAGDNINHHPDAHTISILISALANKGEAYAAIRIFWDLLDVTVNGSNKHDADTQLLVPPVPKHIITGFCYAAALRACAKVADKAMAERILARWEGGAEWEVMTAAMEVFAVCGDVERVLKMFKGLEKDILKEWSGISDVIAGGEGIIDERMVDAVTTLGCAHNIVLEALCRSRRFEEAREKYAYITQHQRLGRVRTYVLQILLDLSIKPRHTDLDLGIQISHDLSSRLTNEDDRSLRRRSISLIGALMGVLRGKGRLKDVLQVLKGLGYIGKGEDAIRVVAIAVHAALDLGKLEAAKSFVKDMDGLKSMAMVVARERLREAIEKAA